MRQRSLWSRPLAVVGAVIALGTAGVVAAAPASARPAGLELTFVIPSSVEIALPLQGTVSNITVDWGDTSSDHIDAPTNLSHDYAAGTYHVDVWGTQLSHFGDPNWEGAQYLTEVTSWGDAGLTDLSYAFNGASTLSSVPAAAPTGVTSLRETFSGAVLFNGSIGGWDTSSVTDMYATFLDAHAFNQPLAGWDTSNVTTTSWMFAYATIFNQPIGGWDVSGVTDTTAMFVHADAFNQRLGTWNTSSVAYMNQMFLMAGSFNQPLMAWNTGNVTSMHDMFAYAGDFNQPLWSWNTGNVADMSGMFQHAASFDQPIGQWDTSKVTDMSGMFDGALMFDQDLGYWNVSQVTTMAHMWREGWTSLSSANYGYLLVGWASRPVQAGVVFDVGRVVYPCTAISARATLTSAPNSWSITDDGLTPQPCVQSVTITGMATVGRTLRAVAHGVSGDPTPTPAYQWQSSANGTSGWSDVPGATSVTFPVPAAQTGRFLRVVAWVTFGRPNSAVRTVGQPLPVGGCGTPIVYRVSLQFLPTSSTCATSVATSRVIGPPSAPLHVVASPRNGRVVVSWSAPSSTGGAAVTSYQVKSSMWTGGGRYACATTARTCTISGLQNGHRYTFWVTAFNVAGAGIASPRTPTTVVGAPSAPRGIVASAPVAGTARVSWGVPTFGGVTPVLAYQVRWSGNAGASWSAWTYVRARSALRVGLTKGHTYQVQVRALNSLGLGPWGAAQFVQAR